MIKEIEKRILSSLIIIPITIFFIYKGSFLFIFFLSICFLFSCYEWIGMSKKKNLIKILGLIFLFFSFYSAYSFRIDQGFKFFLFVILISILTDVGGYIFGKTFKGPKLTKISPNKTYSGFIGSFMVSLIGGLIYLEYFPGTLFRSYLAGYATYIEYNLFILLIILIFSLISQIGDLIISYFKRQAKIKDTGNILPGHGGLLDRIDGIIFTVPFSYIILHLYIY